MLATEWCLLCCETYMGFHQCKALNRICYSCRQYGHISASEQCQNRKNATVPVRPADDQQPPSSPAPVEEPKEEPEEPVSAALDMPFSGLTDQDFSNHVPGSRQFTEVKQQMSLQQQLIKHKKIIEDLNLTAENLNKWVEFLQQEIQHHVDFIINLDQFCIGSFLETTTIISEYETAIEDLCETFGKGAGSNTSVVDVDFSFDINLRTALHKTIPVADATRKTISLTCAAGQWMFLL